MSYTVLIVDDEPDMHAVTRMSLKRMQFGGEDVELVFAESGSEALEYMENNPQTAVILMDVVMEDKHAGLTAVKVIRERLKNTMVRILLRTGQPGVAPEKDVIDSYDIDGYMAKQELTQTRLYSCVRTALKSYKELQELHSHKLAMIFLNQSLVNLHRCEDLEESLEEALDLAGALVPSNLTVLYLETADDQFLMHRGAAENAEDLTEALVKKIQQQPMVLQADPQNFEGGFLVPFSLLGMAGNGFLFVEPLRDMALLKQTLPILAAHTILAAQRCMDRFLD